MISISWSPVVRDLVVLTLVGLWLSYVRRRRASPPYPPGPPGLPIVGNILDIPEQNQWVTYVAWARQFKSPIIHLRFFNTHVMVLNDKDTVKELLHGHAANFSCRPRLPLINEALGFGWAFGFSSDMDLWRAGRRAIDARFKQGVVRQYQPQQKAMVARLIRRLSRTPDKFREHFLYCMGAFIMDVAYGIEVQAADDKYLQIAEQAMQGLRKSGDRNIIDVLPWVQFLPNWLPGMGWKRQIDDWKISSYRMRDVPFDFVKEQMLHGTARPCFATDLLENFELSLPQSWREYVIKGTLGNAYIGGYDTTAASLDAFILAMAMSPTAQSKAQAELDRVIGSRRLPDFSDEPEMPYISAIVKEIHRWFTLAPIATPKTCSEDQVYRGYLIPKGSLMLANTWSVTYDPDVYRDPELFKPERWLSPSGELDPNGSIDIVFGNGKRICPGRFMATEALWLAIANILSVFSISPKPGYSLPERVNFTPGFMRQVPDFQCDIKPRLGAVTQLYDHEDDQRI